MITLGDWIAAVCADLGIDQAEVPERAILDVARDAAHQVNRPAAPVTAFLLGYAVGRGHDLVQTAARLNELAASWPPAPDEASKP